MLQVLVAISQKLVTKKKHGAIQKLFIKKEKKTKKKGDEKKMGMCPRYLKQWVLRCSPEKRRERDE